MELFRGRRRRGEVVQASLDEEPRSDLPTDGEIGDSRAPGGDLEASSDVAEAAGDRWLGYIDFIDRTLVTGWACDSQHLERTVLVEAVASNGKRLAALAGVYRQDVRDAGYGTGRYGFEIDVAPLGLKDEAIVVRFAESKVAITKAPFSLDPQRALLDGKLPPAYTSALQLLALDARAKHNELDEHGEAF